jgi:diadenosine tetraphosphate (Ap4A) HIT family hydrolase
MPTPPPSPCPACTRLTSNITSDPFFIAELRETIAVVHAHQCLRGWCVLLLKDHVEHLSTLPFARQASIFEDVARLTAAVRAVAHVHWHIVPRYEAPVDPDPLKPVWVFGQPFLECGADPSTVKTLAAQLRSHIPA